MGRPRLETRLEVELEDRVAIRLRNPRAFIVDQNLVLAGGGALEADLDRRARRGELHRVAEHVGDRLAEAQLVEETRQGRSRLHELDHDLLARRVDPMQLDLRTQHRG